MECKHVQGEFLSAIFSVKKKNGKIRLILNLKQLKDAYYSVKVTLITNIISDFVTTIRFISTQHTLMVCIIIIILY
jgi:hypothetical protein